MEQDVVGALEISGGEGPQAVGHESAAGEHGPQIREDRRRVEREHRPDGGGFVTQIGLFTLTLPGDHEQRAEARDDEEPFGDRDTGGGGATDGPEHEPGGHSDDVEHRKVFEPQRVGGGEREIGEDREPEVAVHEERPADTADEQHQRQHDAERDRHDAGGDGAVALGGMTSIGLDVGDVVDEIGGAGRGTEAHEGEQGVDQFGALVDDAGGGGGGEDQDVLHPLFRSQFADRPGDE